MTARGTVQSDGRSSLRIPGEHCCERRSLSSLWNYYYIVSESQDVFFSRFYLSLIIINVLFHLLLAFGSAVQSYKMPGKILLVDMRPAELGRTKKYVHAILLTVTPTVNI